MKYNSNVEAKVIPMNRLAYNEYRGYPLPIDENAEDEGYLLEYQTEGKIPPNDARHTGYISWLPKTVFELLITPSNLYQLRVIEEKNQLDEKIKKLDNYIANDAVGSSFSNLSEMGQQLLVEQSAAMKVYSSILQERIDLFD